MKPIVVRSTPVSRSRADSVPNTSSSGRPLEKPRNSAARTLPWRYDRIASIHPGRRAVAVCSAIGGPSDQGFQRDQRARADMADDLRGRDAADARAFRQRLAARVAIEEARRVEIAGTGGVDHLLDL